MSGVSSLLREPLTSIRLTLLERSEWSVLEINIICNNVQLILQKCMMCVDQSLADALFVLLHCLLHCATEDPEKFCLALTKMPYMNDNYEQFQTKEDNTCYSSNESGLQLFAALTCLLFSRENAPLLSALDVSVFLELLQIVCSMSTVKDAFSALIGQRVLVPFMCDKDAHHMDYRLHRGCATCVIALLRGSRANKNRFSANVNEFSVCITDSTDVFFQMQCVEILFRLHTHNPTLLLTATSLKDDVLRRSIMSLPNDETLLERIEECLDGFNSEYHSNDLISFTMLRLTCTSTNLSNEEHVRNITTDKNVITEICKHTTIYFTSSLLIIFVPDGSGENITIPFEHIRSVRLSREHDVTLRLRILPPVLVSILSMLNNSCTRNNNWTCNADSVVLHIHVTQSTLQELQRSPIRNWIARRKQNTPLRPKMYYLSLLTEESSSSRLQEQEQELQYVEGKEELYSEQEMHSSQENQLEVESMSEQNVNTDQVYFNNKNSVNVKCKENCQMPYNYSNVIKNSTNQTTNDQSNNSNNSRHNNIECNEVQSSSSLRAQSHSVLLNKHQHLFLSSSLSSSSSLSALTRSQPTPSVSGFSENKQSTERLNHNSATTTTANTAINNNHNNNVIGTKDTLDEIHKAAAVRVANRMELLNKQRQAALTEIEEHINAMCRENARERTEHETRFRNKMALFRQAEGEMKEFAASCVNSLNSELEEVQELGSVLQHECDELITQITEACNSARTLGDTSFDAIGKRAHEHVRILQDKMENMLLSVNPLHDLVEKLKTCNALDLPSAYDEMRGTETPALQMTRQKMQRIEERDVNY